MSQKKSPQNSPIKIQKFPKKSKKKPQQKPPTNPQTKSPQKFPNQIQRNPKRIPKQIPQQIPTKITQKCPTNISIKNLSKRIPRNSPKFPYSKPHQNNPHEIPPKNPNANPNQKSPRKIPQKMHHLELRVAIRYPAILHIRLLLRIRLLLLRDTLYSPTTILLLPYSYNHTSPCRRACACAPAQTLRSSRRCAQTPSAAPTRVGGVGGMCRYLPYPTYQVNAAMAPPLCKRACACARAPTLHSSRGRAPAPSVYSSARSWARQATGILLY